MMARRGARPRSIEGFAEDLGRLLGSAQAKAQGWLGQRQTIVKHLQQIRDTASNLLSQLGSASSAAGRGLGRRAVVVGVVSKPRRKRKLSAAARKSISDAQKKRWAAFRAQKPKK
jgi:hypothetical protein